MDGTTTKEDVRIDKDDADELNREAAEDLERIENEVKREAEQYVEAVDGDGNEKESVEAAATAFDFDRAEAETEELLIKAYLQTRDDLDDIKVLSFHKGYKTIIGIAMPLPVRYSALVCCLFASRLAS